MATVYWVTGLSGAGKTTIGKKWYEELKRSYDNVVLLDGDELRQVFGNDLGYTKEDRLKSAMRNARLCKMLGEQDIHVVCCTISMFDEVREWNRNNIADYVEIYVKVSMEVLHERDQKNLYTKAKVGQEEDLAGITFQVEEPKCPDLVLGNNGEFTPEEQVNKIKEFIISKENNGNNDSNKI